MAFVKADLKNEKEELDKLVAESGEGKKAYEEFQARIAPQQNRNRFRGNNQLRHSIASAVLFSWNEEGLISRISSNKTGYVSCDYHKWIEAEYGTRIV